MIQNSRQKTAFPRFFVIQNLLSTEQESISLLRKTSILDEVVAFSPSAHDTLKKERISHTYRPILQRSWYQVNQALFDMLKDKTGPDAQNSPDHLLDTWSHFLISEINHLYLLGEAIISACQVKPLSMLVIKHAFHHDDFDTLYQALLQVNLLRDKQIIEWKDFYG